MNNYQQRLNQELVDPVSVLQKALKLSEELMKTNDKKTAQNNELYADIQKIYHVVNNELLEELRETNEYLTVKYQNIVNHSNNILIIVDRAQMELMTAQDHTCVLSIYAQLLYSLIQHNNYAAVMRKLDQTMYSAAEHIGESAIKAWLK